MKQTTQTTKEKYLIPEVEITNFIVENGFQASPGDLGPGGDAEPTRGSYADYDGDDEMYSY